jgi:putative proteasome-type protease
VPPAHAASVAFAKAQTLTQTLAQTLARSNIAVGLPIDILVARRDAYNPEVNYRIESNAPYFADLRDRWSGALRAAHIAIPRPPYRSPGG